MQAVRSHEYGGPEVFRVEEVASPEPGAGQVLVAVHAAGVNPMDTYIRSGTNGYRANFPHTPGADGAGVVAAVGPDVSGFEVGDRVYFSLSLTGSAAEYTLTRATHTYHLPAALTYEAGACLGIPAFTAFQALFLRGQAQAGETVLIHGGTGAVGTLAVQLARVAGLSVTATAGSDQGAQLLHELGAERVLNHRTDGYLAAWQEDSRGFDLIVEMLADVNLDADLKALAPDGRVLVVGSRGDIEITPRDLMKRLADVRGVALPGLKAHAYQEIARRLEPLLASGRVRPVVRQVYALDELGQAQADVLTPGAAGNRVIQVRP